jgi:hypothetical protein
MNSRKVLATLLCVSFAFTTIQSASAQTPDTCPALVTYAITQLATNCADTDPNSACYGYETVGATFDPAAEVDTFSEPGDRADLTTIQAVQTGPFDLTEQQWGLSLMNVQANLPNALPGAVYVLLGGVEVENDVEPEDALELLEEGAAVNASSEAELRTYPEGLGFIDSEVIETIPAGAALTADAVSADGEWARVAYQDTAGWISAAALQEGDSLNDLPVITPDDRTPMQSFYFRVGIGGQTCSQAPSLLIIQSPPDVPVDIRLHDTNIRIESTIVLRTLPPGDQLGDAVELITLFGLATIRPGEPDAIRVPPGYSSQVSLGEFADLGIEGDEDEKTLIGEWSDPRALTQDEFDQLGVLSTLPANILHFPIEIPSIVRPSGIGQVIARLLFRNPRALAAARRACERDLLPENICQYLGL